MCLLSSKQLTVKRSRPNIWSLKTCENVEFISNLLSGNVLTFRALSLRRITTVLFVYQGVVSRHKKFLRIDFSLSLMFRHRVIRLCKVIWKYGFDSDSEENFT